MAITLPPNNNTGLYNNQANVLPVANNISITGNIKASGYISAGGNIYGNSLYVSNIESVTGNIQGGNLYTPGEISAVGNITGGNITTVGTVTAGNITAGNVVISNVVIDNVDANTILSNTISASGNITGDYLLANIYYATGYSASKIYNGTSEANIGTANGNAAFSINGTSNVVIVAQDGLHVAANTVSGNLQTTGEISSAGNITAGPLGYFVGDGRYLSNIVTAGTNITNGNSDVSVAANSNVTVNVANTQITTFSTAGQATQGIISASGNIYGDYFNGNIFYANGYSAFKIYNGNSEANIGTSGGNANISIGGVSNVVVVATDGIRVTGLSSTTGNVIAGNVRTAGIISATGNIQTAGYFLGTFQGNISGNLTVPGSNTQVLYNNNGNAGASAGLTFNSASNVLTNAGNTVSGNLLTAGLVTATGNVTGGNILTAGLVTATGNLTAGNIRTAGLITATGNLTAGNISTAGITSVAGNILSSGNISATGNITGAYIVGNIAPPNLNVPGNITVGGYISSAGNIVTSANINLLGPGRANFVGNTSLANANITTLTTNYIGVYPTANTPSNWTTLGTTLMVWPGNGIIGSGGSGWSTGNAGAGFIDLTSSQQWNTAFNIPKTTGNFIAADKFYGDYVTLGNTTFGANSNIYGNVNVLAYSPGGNALAYGGNIIANAISANSVSVATVLTAPTYVANNSVEAGTFISAGTYITAVGNIISGANITAGGNIKGGNLYLSGGNALYALGNITAGNISLSAPGTGGANITAGNIILSNNLSTAFGSLIGATISATGNLAGGNIRTANIISAGGNITGGNILTAGNIGATNVNTSNLSLAGNVISALNVTGNIAGTNLFTPGQVSAGGNVLVTGNVSSAGNVIGAYIWGDGSNITGVTSGASSTQIQVKNVTAYTILKGSPVYTTGAVGASTTLEVQGSRADWANTMPAIGLATTNMAPNDVSYAMSVGTLTGMDTSAYTAGQTLYVAVWVNTSVLPITGTRPNSNYVVQPIGTVGRVNASNGSIDVNIWNYLQLPNLGNGNIWLGNANSYPTETNLSSYFASYPGNISATGNVMGSGIYASGNISTPQFINGDGSNLYFGKIDVGGVISAYGNIIANANVNVTGKVSAAGNVQGAFIIGDGSLLTNIPGGTYGNANVANYLPTFSGNISAGNISVTGNITGNYIIGNGSQLTGLPAGYANTNVASYLSSGTVTANILTTGEISATGNITSAGNINAAGFSASGNITLGGGAYRTSNATAYIVNTVATTVNIGGGANIGVNIGNSTGSANIRGNVTIGGSNVSHTVNGNTFTINPFTVFNAGANIGSANGLNVNSGNIVLSTGNLTIGGGYIKGGSTANAYIFYNSSNTMIMGNSLTGAANTGIQMSGYISASGNITGGNLVSGNVYSTPVAFANLPTAVSGAKAFVNDANLTASGNFGSQISGGGSNTTPVWSDGTNWYIG